MSPEGNGAAASGAQTTEQAEQRQAPLHQEEKPRPRSSNAELLALVVENGQREDYARQIIDAELARDAFDQDWKLAKVFAWSGVFGDIKGSTENQAIATAMAKIQLGRSWGLTPGDSMQFVYFTNGRPAVMNELVASKLEQAGITWDVEWHTAKVNNRDKCVGCTLWIKKDGKPLLDRKGGEVSVSFTKEDADTAMIWEKGKQIPLSSKWNFESWAEDMYYWRCVSRVKKRYAPGVLRGASLAEELENSSEPPAGVDPTGIRQGTRADQERVAEEKIAALEAERDKRNALKETPAERDARIQRQIDEQTEDRRKRAEAEKAQQETGQEPSSEKPAESEPAEDSAAPRQRPVFGRKNQ